MYSHGFFVICLHNLNMLSDRIHHTDYLTILTRILQKIEKILSFSKFSFLFLTKNELKMDTVV